MGPCDSLARRAQHASHTGWGVTRARDKAILTLHKSQEKLKNENNANMAGIVGRSWRTCSSPSCRPLPRQNLLLAVASNNGSHVREVSLARTRLAIAVGEKSHFHSCTAQHKREPKPSISGQYSGLEGAAAGVELGRGCGEGCREICLTAPLHLRHAVVACLTTPVTT